MHRVLSIAALVACVASTAQASVFFTNISVTGPAGLIGTPGIITGTRDIDISFNGNAGLVGEPTNLFSPIMPIVITYDVASDEGPLNSATLSLLGAASGNGTVSCVTQVRTLPLPGAVIGNNAAGYNLDNPPPTFTQISFSQGAATFRVTQTITFGATNTAAVDFAQLSLVEMHFAPAPGATALLGVGGLLMFRRRR